MTLTYKEVVFNRTSEFYNKLNIFCYEHLLDGAYLPLINKYAQIVMTDAVKKINTDNRNKLQLSFSKFLSKRNKIITNLIDSLIDKDTMQIVSIGLGFDLNPYIIKTKNKHTKWFAVESQEILNYLESLMLEEKPKFNLLNISSSINDEKLITKLINSGFNPNKKTLIIVDGIQSNIGSINELSLIFNRFKNLKSDFKIIFDVPIVDSLKKDFHYTIEGLNAIRSKFKVFTHNSPDLLFKELGFEINGKWLISNENENDGRIFLESLLVIRQSNIFDLIRVN